MPRLARLDAPGVLHHVMDRGIERRKIFLNKKDQKDFIDRLAELAVNGSMSIYTRGRWFQNDLSINSERYN